MKIDSRESLVRDIADAMQNFTNEFDNRWFLNLTEQEVGIRVDPDYCDPDCLWPKDGDEVVEIDPVPSHEAFHAMEAFSDEQPRPIAEKLYRALSGSRPFARFKAAIEREQNHACMSSAEREQARPKGKSAAQVALRWLTQRGIVAIPKSTHKERMAQNLDIFDFTLTDEDMAQIATMNQHDTGTVNFSDPNFVKYLIETYG